MNKTLHIVSFAVPFPADYGGVIEVFYKLKALHECGVDVILHCFMYDMQGQQFELEKYCKAVYYYERNNSVFKLLSLSPYIVKSRQNEELLTNLLRDDAPILFEGVHTSAYLNHPLLKQRKKYLRMANIESKYYQGLFEASSNIFKKLYYGLESWKLKRYEKSLGGAEKILAISQMEYQVLSLFYGRQAVYIPPFHAFVEMIDKPKEDFLLYHGNLKVEENDRAAKYLVEEVFSKLPYPAVIAGKSPSKALMKMIDKHEHIQCVESPDDDRLQQLIQTAKVNVLYTHQSTGLKLKLLNVLYNGGFVVVNDAIAEGTNLKQAMIVCKEEDEMIFKIDKAMKDQITWSKEDRKCALASNYQNKKNGEALSDLIFSA